MNKLTISNKNYLNFFYLNKFYNILGIIKIKKLINLINSNKIHFFN